MDAATITSGWAVLDSTESGLSIAALGVYKSSPKQEITERLSDLRGQVQKTIEKHDPDILAVEKIMFTGGNKFLMSLGSVCKAVGVVESVYGEYPDKDYRTYTATQVRALAKKDKSTKGRKTKKDLRIFLNNFFSDDLIEHGYPKGLLTKHEDISDALGLALLTHIRIRTELRNKEND